MRLRLPRRRIWRIAIYLISLLLVWIAADLILVQVQRNFSYGYDTTRIVSPVLPDGRIDYLSVLDQQYGEGVTPQNNAAVLFLQAAGRKALSPSQPTDGITDKLGMPHLPEQGDYLVGREDFIKQHGVMDKDRSQLDLPTSWPVAINPLAEQWVDENNHPLDLLIKASKRSRFHIPFGGGNRPEVLEFLLLPHVGLLKESGQLLLMRAMIRLKAGDVAGFREDLLATHRLARLMGQLPTAIERAMARETLEDPACEIGRVAAASGALSAEQARSLAADLAALGDLRPMSDSIDGERFMVLDLLQTVATVPPDQGADIFNGILGTHGIGPNILFRFAPLPFEAAMRHMNHCYDGALAALYRPDYPTRIAAMNLWEKENLHLTNGPLMLISPSFPAPELLFSISRMEQREETSRTQMRLTRIALALAAYKADHQGYPATVNELSPAYLAEIPNDPYSEKPFVYAATSNGYALHSVGPDMSDENGSRDDITANLP
jgi:hypothetical protein